MSNTSYYLYNGSNWWTMTPYASGGEITANMLIVGTSIGNATTISTSGIRPAVSLQSGIKFAGVGTAINPYTVSFN